MKKQLFVLLLICGTAPVLLTGSSYDPYAHRSHTPVFMEREALFSSVFYRETPRELENPGKIYARGHYIFVNERYKGVHIINNSDPATPRSEGFIVAPGCIDMAVKGDILYLDNAIDLVAFDLTARKEVGREKNVFPEPLSPQGWGVYGNRPEGMIVVGWRQR